MVGAQVLRNDPALLRDLYPSREALDEAIDDCSTGGAVEQFEELGRLLPTLGGP
jgi:hypothetical protein